MGKDILNALGGFEAIAQSISNQVTPDTDIIENEDDPIVDPDEINNDDSTGDEIDDPIVDPKETEEEEEIKDDEDTPPSIKDTNDVDDLGDSEPEIAAFVQEKLFDSLGLDKDDELEIKSIEDVVEYMKALVEENSIPEYANDDIRKIDEYVRNGGDIKKFMSEAHGDINLETINLETESNQKRIITEHLKSKKYTDTRIQKMLDRYEDAGTLEEEAEDALDMLKEYRTEMSETLLEKQKKENADILERKQNYIKNVEEEINSIENIRGISLSKSDRKNLTNYIFKPTSDGRTQYQKDYLKSNKHLIESAYLTMKGDTLDDKVQRRAASDAARNLKKKLAEKGKRTKDQSEGLRKPSVSSIWGAASNQLRKPN